MGMEPTELKGEPAYARLQIGGTKLTVLLDRSEDESRLYANQGGDGNLRQRDVKVALLDQNSDGLYNDPDRDALSVDVDGDGALLTTPDPHERFAIDAPFNIDGTGYVVASISPEHGIDYRQIYDGPDGPIGEIYRIGGIPMIYLIDEDGIIRGRDLTGADLIEGLNAFLTTGEGG